MAHKSWIRGAFGLAVLMVTAAAAPAAAQPLGVFRWQQQPFCNVLNLAVTATPSGFRMEGTDDQCGGTPASAIGMAYLKADSTVGVGLTLIFSSAVSLHIDATIIPGAGFNGSWSDSVGRAGQLLLAPGASLGGPLRPVVVPIVTYGAMVAQPAGGGDRGLSVAVATDTGGTGNDAAAVFGQFGGATAFSEPGSAGVRGDSAEAIGVLGTTHSGLGVAGAAKSDGIAIQGYAEGPNSVSVHAVHAQGGTALEINNGAIRVTGAVRAAFKVNIPAGGGPPWVPGAFICQVLSHPLLEGDPNAMVLVTLNVAGLVYARSAFRPGPPPNNVGWDICTKAESGGQASVLVIKQ
jgi:hypothetical protein